MCEDNIEYDNDLKNEDYLKYEGGQPKIYIQSHIFNYLFILLFIHLII